MNCMKIIYRIGILYFLCLSAGCSNSKKEIEPDNLFVTFDVPGPPRLISRRVTGWGCS